MSAAEDTPRPPRVAVIIPCYDDGATLRETVDSVRAQEPCELVVVDDGSSDPATLAVCDALRAEGVTVVQQENQGLPAARMAGLAATSARYVYPLDSDDLLAPGALAALADVLDAESELVGVWGATWAFGESGTQRREVARLDAWRITHNTGMPYAGMFRRDALEAAGGWSLRGGYEDWDLWLGLAERGGQVRHVSAPALQYRVHHGRMWADAMSRHDQIVTELRRRHPTLWEQRRANWRRSGEPWRVRLLFPLIGALPRASSRTRLRCYTTVDDPRHAAELLVEKLRRARG
ncbi:MAG TPA: glycosyltransferase family A protein [Conexibacter sp.]|nr:glycosyltransferase family A protein [Conexibacter sp.]